VKFLVDANLPPRLCSWLRSHRHEAEHVFDRNLLTATDTQIWERGRVENLVIFSKDTDFYDRALLFGTPPQVVHVAVGNCSNTTGEKGTGCFNFQEGQGMIRTLLLLFRGTYTRSAR
jgi:predicted nuclease of predicted toxin-antitoxin system